MHGRREMDQWLFWTFDFFWPHLMEKNHSYFRLDGGPAVFFHHRTGKWVVTAGITFLLRVCGLISMDLVLFLCLNSERESKLSKRSAFSRLLEAVVLSGMLCEGTVDSRVSHWCSLTSDHQFCSQTVSSLSPLPSVAGPFACDCHFFASIFWSFIVLWDWLCTFATVCISFWRLDGICSQTRLDPLIL